MKMEPTRIEILLAFLIACVGMAGSLVLARHADSNTIADPGVRRLVHHAYGGVTFQLIGVVILATCLLPNHIREKYLHATDPVSRLMVYFTCLWSLLPMVAVCSDVSRALQASTASLANTTCLGTIFTALGLL
jgi:hypothetical protein